MAQSLIPHPMTGAVMGGACTCTRTEYEYSSYFDTCDVKSADVAFPADGVRHRCCVRTSGRASQIPMTTKTMTLHSQSFKKTSGVDNTVQGRSQS
eukprot:336278-Chlamydomonas_euryale.AAC.5